MMLTLVVMVVVFALFHVLLGKLKGYVECTMCFFSESNFLFASYRMKGGVGPWVLGFCHTAAIALGNSGFIPLDFDFTISGCCYTSFALSLSSNSNSNQFVQLSI